MSLTKQQIFDNVWDTFIVKDLPLAKPNDDGTCFYRLKGTVGCAVGCQLPSHLYNENMEHNTIVTLFQDYPKVKEYFGEDNLELLASLQRWHDDADKDLTWLKQIAMSNSLEIPNEK